MIVNNEDYLDKVLRKVHLRKGNIQTKEKPAMQRTNDRAF